MYCTYCGKINDNNDDLCKNCGAALLPHVDVKNLQYTPIPSEYAESFGKVKVFLFNRQIKKFVKSVENSECGTCKVMVERTFLDKYCLSNEPEPNFTASKDESYAYANLRTMDGNPVEQAVRVLGYFVKDELQEAYILKYKAGLSYTYVLIKSADPKYICEKLEDIITLKHSELINRSEPKREGVIKHGLSKFGKNA